MRDVRRRARAGSSARSRSTVEVDYEGRGRSAFEVDRSTLPDPELDDEQRERLLRDRRASARCTGRSRRDDGRRSPTGRERLSRLMDLGLAGRACVVTGASRGIGRETARLLCAEGATVLLVARDAERLRRGQAEAAAPAAGRRRGPRRWRSTSPTTDAGERIVAAAERALRRPRRARQQRRHRELARPRRRPGRGLARGQYELNVMAPLRAMRAAAPGDGRARLGPGRQRLLDRRQAPLGGDARVLGRQGGRALALAPVRRPLRRERRARQRDLPRPDRIGDVDGAGGLLDQSQRARRRRRAARRRSPQPARSARSAASPRPRRSPPRSSSSAPSAPPTSPAPPGRSTAAPCR